ncbi:MAG: hypothetical protein OXE82_02940 [Rhodobacter sp.]|nr:hypothetical protein [Rhodobacter sp.]
MPGFQNLSVTKFSVRITEKDEWFIAVSEDIPELHLYHWNIETLVESIPEAVKGLIKIKSGREVQVVRVEDSFPGLIENVAPNIEPQITHVDSPWMMCIVADRIGIEARA